MPVSSSITVISETDTNELSRKDASENRARESKLLQETDQYFLDRAVEEAERLSEYSVKNEGRAKFMFWFAFVILVITAGYHIAVIFCVFVVPVLSNPNPSELDRLVALSKAQLPALPAYIFVLPLLASITFGSLAAIQSGVSRKRLLEMLSPLSSMAGKTTGK